MGIREDLLQSTMMERFKEIPPPKAPFEGQLGIVGDQMYRLRNEIFVHFEIETPEKNQGFSAK